MFDKPFATSTHNGLPSSTFDEKPFFSGSQAQDPFFPPSTQNQQENNSSDNLTSPRFAGNPRLEAAYDNAPPIRKGETGDAVARIQETLVDDGFAMPISTKPTGEMDGIFGSETFDTVWNFQFKHGLDTDGVVGHNTLDELQDVKQENKQKDPDKQQKECNDIKKFGKVFASAVDVTVFQHPPAARTRDNSPTEIMFSTGGFGAKSVLEVNANASMAPMDPGDAAKFQHGLIQTTKLMVYNGTYGNGKKASRKSTNSRDAQPGTPAPWIRNVPAAGSPMPFLVGSGAGKGVHLEDMPQHFLPIEHPKDPTATLEKIDFKTVFEFWHIAKETNSDGADANNIAFLANFQITLDSKASKAPNGNFVGELNSNKISRAIACGKGSATPVLDKPITIEDLQTLSS